MNDVEKFYEAARKFYPQSKPWAELNPMLQMQLVQAINMILGTLHS